VRSTSVALDEPLSLFAHLLDARALSGRLRELLQDGSLIEGVGAHCEPALPREPLCERMLVDAIDLPVIEALLTGYQQLLDLFSPQPELRRSGSYLAEPAAGVDVVLLAISGGERRRLSCRLRLESDAAALRRGDHLLAAL
jgi:hypothetical protein